VTSIEESVSEARASSLLDHDVASGRSTWNFITLSEATVRIAGNNAIARHIFTGENVSGGKTTPIKIGILMVWQKQDGGWKLLARQAYTL
jgi:ketosteroid isomerase-like protein